MMAEANIEMKQEICCNCHMVFWMPHSFYRQCSEQRPHKEFWCPAGHRQHYIGESDLDKMRRRAQQAEQHNAMLHAEARAAVQERNAAQADLKRHQRRTKAGLCPCCNRSFINMQRHIKTKHPDYNVVPLKGATS